MSNCSENLDIIIKDLTINFEGNGVPLKVLDHLSLSVKRGQMCCIVGPSGCGKSTLLRAILGLVPITSGDIHLDEYRLKKGIAFVQQDSPLLPWRTSLQNACLGAEVKGNINHVIVDRIRRQLSDFGLAGFEDNLSGELSGGMRQRVAIARALESRPALLFCDEPFSAVDFVGRLSLTSRFKHLSRVRGITTIFVTHNIEEAIFLGDVIMVMSGRPGRIVNEHFPMLSVGSEDAVSCRKAPEFAEYFQKIWQDLKDNHE